MSWTREQLLKHPKAKSLLGVNIKSQGQATEKAKDSEKSTLAPSSQDPRIFPSPPSQENEISFVVVGDPMGKPRMTKRDKWKKRPVVERYHDYCDRIKEATPNRLLTADVYAIAITAFIAMPESWSIVKKAAHLGQIHRAKPDWDNIGKAICDALFKEDSIIADGRARKFWCREGEQRTEIRVWHISQTSSK